MLGLKYLGAALVLCGSVAAGATQPTTTPARPAVPDSAAILDLVQRFIGAQAQFQPDALRTLTTDDYEEVSPVGDVDSREKMISFYGPEAKVEVLRDQVSDPEVRIVGDTAIEVARLTFEFKLPDGSSHTSTMRATFIARKSVSGWKLEGAQYTNIPAILPPLPAAGKQAN